MLSAHIGRHGVAQASDCKVRIPIEPKVGSSIVEEVHALARVNCELSLEKNFLYYNKILNGIFHKTLYLTKFSPQPCKCRSIQYIQL